MSNNTQSKLAQLAMDPAAKQRSSSTMTIIFVAVGVALVAALLTWKPWAKEGERYVTGDGRTQERGPKGSVAGAAPTSASGSNAVAAAASTNGNVALVVS